jgi:hypothetical protein
MVSSITPPSNTVYLAANQNCQNGQILDPSAMPNAAMIVYSGQTQSNATLQMDGSWNITMGGGGF